MTGDVVVTSLALAQPGKAVAPFLVVPRIDVGLKEVNLVTRVVTLSAIDIQGLDLKAVRDKQENIDLLELTKKPDSAASAACTRGAEEGAGSSAPTPTPPAKAEPEFKITVEKVTLKGAATFTDESVSAPADRPEGEQPGVQVDDVTWPNIRPMNLLLSMNPPGGGKIGAKGAVKLEPLDVTLTLNTRDAPIEPYRAYFPVPANFSGRFSSDSQNRVRIVNGKLTALSRGQ